VRRLRTASTRSLAAFCAAALALVLTATIAQAALTGSAAPPSPKALANAILDAFNAPEPEGITARIHFTNGLLPAGALPGHGASPLAAGANGRLWIQAGGRFRLELQSDAGDAQIVSDGDRVTVYDGSSNTVYRAALPKGTEAAARPHHRRSEKLTLAKIERVLDRLAERWTISGADPTTTAGRPAYSVKIAPKDDGGLLGAARLAWDAVSGAPLRAAVYARGQADPVLELEATEISYDAVPDAAIDVAPPAGAKVTDLTTGDRAHPGARATSPSSVAAADTLAGLRLTALRPVTLDGRRGSLAVYGRGLGAIAVLQQRAAGKRSAGASGGRHDRSLRLPQIDIGGDPATELATPLGTIVTFERDGVATVVAGSAPRAAVEKVARALP
jgi:outer membrane lipoprotein-sorting protein